MLSAQKQNHNQLSCAPACSVPGPGQAATVRISNGARRAVAEQLQGLKPASHPPECLYGQEHRTDRQ